MEKVVLIENREIPMKATAATYIKYRSLFHEDLFTALQKVGESVADGEKMPDGAIDCLMKASYVMACQANPKERRSFEDWFDQFSLMGALDGVGAVYELLLGDKEPIEEAKKNKDQPSAE